MLTVRVTVSAASRPSPVSPANGRSPRRQNASGCSAGQASGSNDSGAWNSQAGRSSAPRSVGNGASPNSTLVISSGAGLASGALAGLPVLRKPSYACAAVIIGSGNVPSGSVAVLVAGWVDGSVVANL